MKLTKTVPVDAALRAAAATSSRTDPFEDWAENCELRDYSQMPVDEVRALIKQVPNSPAGAAWAAAARTSVELAEADVWRPYDQLRYTETERPVRERIFELSETLRRDSVLLNTVADSVLWHSGAGPGLTLGQVSALRAGFTAEHIEVHVWSGSSRTTHQVPLWQVEALHPGFTIKLTDLLEKLDADLPEIAEDDDGAARTPQGPEASQ